MSSDPDEAPTLYRLPPQGPPASTQPGEESPVLPPAQPGSAAPEQATRVSPAQPANYPAMPTAPYISVPPASYPAPPPPPAYTPGAGAQAAPPGTFRQQTTDAFVPPPVLPPFQSPPPAAPPGSYPPYQAGSYQAGSYPAGSYQPAAPAGYAGAPARAAPFTLQTFWRELALLGQVTGIAGVLLAIFFFLPWFHSPAFTTRNPGGQNPIATVSHSGWRAASGLPIFDANTSLTLFPHLWLIFLSALALVVVAVLLGVHRLRVRRATPLIVALSVLALVMEFFFLIQINSIENAFAQSQLGTAAGQSGYGVSWGFWLSVALTVAALGVGLFMLLQEYGVLKRTLPGSPGMAGEPGQPMHPTT